MTACDPEKERSRKILQPEIDLGKGFWNFALARVLFAQLTFFEVFAISRLSELQKVRIRVREADAGNVMENRRLQAKYHASRRGAHGVEFSQKYASASSKCDFGETAGICCSSCN